MQIKYSPELLTDFHKLVADFAWFMSMNLLHADKGLVPDKQRKMQSLIKYSLDNCKQFNSIFTMPLLSNEAKNKDVLITNFQNIITFFYHYIKYANPILKECKPDIYAGRFNKLIKHYKSFHHKHIGLLGGAS